LLFVSRSWRSAKELHLSNWLCVCKFCSYV